MPDITITSSPSHTRKQLPSFLCLILPSLYCPSLFFQSKTVWEGSIQQGLSFLRLYYVFVNNIANWKRILAARDHWKTILRRSLQNAVSKVGILMCMYAPVNFKLSFGICTCKFDSILTICLQIQCKLFIKTTCKWTKFKMYQGKTILVYSIHTLHTVYECCQKK
jgi:hypothetical protein